MQKMALFERSTNGVLGALKTENLPVSMQEGAVVKSEPLLTLDDLPALGDAMNSTTTPSTTKTPKGHQSNKHKFAHNDQENSGSKRQRLEFGTMGIQRGKSNSMQRRNARERNRVRYLNMTFEVLRQHLPYASATKSKNKKISKVDTLRGAIDYIRDLKNMLEDSDAVDAALKGCDPNTAFMESELMSPGGSLSPEGSPNMVSEDGVTSEDDDLLDVNTWFSC